MMFNKVKFIAVIVIETLLLSSFSYASEEFYTVQVGSFIDFENAQKQVEALKQNLDKDKHESIRIVKYKKFYRVRVGKFKDILDAKIFYQTISSLFPNAIILKDSTTNEDVVVNHDQENSYPSEVNKEQSKQIKIGKVYDEELLKLLLITFLGNQDLENAYIVAKKGAELFPNNPYWLKSLGQVAIWTKRPAEGIEAYLKLYQITKNENTKRELFNLALATNRFDIATNLVEKDALSGKFNDLKTLLYIYQQAGEVKKLTEILEAMYEKDKNIDILRNLTMILYNYGDLDKASKYGEILYSRQDKNYRDVLLYSSILYAKKDLKKSLEVLKSYFPNIIISKDIEEDRLEYLYTLSDLAWALRDFDISINIATQLDKIDKGRLVEYIRLYTYFYYKKEYKLSADYALKGYEKYKDSYLLSGYIESLYLTNDYQKIVEFVESNKIDYYSSALILSRYISSLLKLNQTQKALNIAKNVLDKKFDPQIISELIFASIESSNQNLAKYIASNYKKYETVVPKSFTFLYLFLENTKKALELSYNQLKNSKSISDKLLYADILYTYGRFEESEKIKYEVFKELKDKQNLSSEDAYNFLRVADEYLSSRQYLELLEKYKNIISLESYNDLYFSHLLKIDNHPKLEYLMKRHSYNLHPWMQLNLASWLNDKYWQDNLLEKFADILPIRDRVTAFTETGQIDKAMYYGYKGLDENPDYLLYKQQRRDLITTYRPKVEILTNYTDRAGVKDISEDAFIQAKLKEGFYPFFRYKGSNPFSVDNSKMINVPDRNDTAVGFKKIIDDGELNFAIGSLKTISSNLYLDVQFRKYIKNKTYFGGEFGKNIPADDTLFLYYGGMKDMLSFNFSHSFNNRTGFYISPSYNIYHSSDGKKIGTSFNLYDEFYYKLRVGYPDYTFRLYSSHGKYNEKDGYKGNIEKLSPYQNTKFLPQSFNLIGVGFSFGYDNDTNYVRVWRPFFSADITYNDITGLGYGFSGGVGGGLFRQDNLSLGFRYIQGFKGTTDKYFNSYLRYILFY